MTTMHKGDPKPRPYNDEEVITLLVMIYPICIKEDAKQRMPLKKGIVEDIERLRLKDFEGADVRSAINAYSSHPDALKNMIAGTPRIDLFGNQDGVVSEKDAELAQSALDKQLVRRFPPSRVEPPPSRVIPQRVIRSPTSNDAIGAIEDDVPIPAAYSWFNRSRQSKYQHIFSAIEALQVGQSMTLRIDREQSKDLRNSLINHSKKIKRHFVTRTVEPGVIRIWRDK
jgi:sRNA-binding protein